MESKNDDQNEESQDDKSRKQEAGETRMDTYSLMESEVLQ